MKAENIERVITRIQVKEIIRRQATIGREETMFDGVCPIEYGAGAAGILPLDTIMRRVLVLEKWIDSELPPMPVFPKP